jgi:hypothetical protein
MSGTSFNASSVRFFIFSSWSRPNSSDDEYHLFNISLIAKLFFSALSELAVIKVVLSFRL